MWWRVKRKATVLASTVVDHTLPLLPSVRQPKFLWVTVRFSFARLSHASRSRSRKCLRHCSLVIVECSADIWMGIAIASRPQKRTQTGASSNLHFTCFIFHYIHLGFSIFQPIILPWDSEELTKNNQRTTKEHEEQGKCSFRALIRSFQFHFLHVFMISQLVYRNI